MRSHVRVLLHRANRGAESIAAIDTRDTYSTDEKIPAVVEAKAEEPKAAKAKAPKEEPRPAPELAKEEVKEVAAPQPVPAKGPHTFEVVVERNGRLGLQVEMKESCLLCVRVIEGCNLEAYNKTAPADRRLECTDFVVEVNGQKVLDKMVQEVNDASTVKMKVVRSVPFTVKIKKGGKPMGVGLTYQKDSIAIDLKEFRDGAVKDYNSTAPPESRLEVNDSIISVNGVAATPEKMVEVIKNSPEMELCLIRAPRA
mmetsp:Transcript_30340/g.100678  ORF Transcript_30340/g.100678 Transcript_30340/m.100678 type:complete len:255 (+) Transcript_30340:72-836(+)